MEDKGVQELCRQIAEDSKAQAAEVLRKTEEKTSSRLNEAREAASRAAGEILQGAERDAGRDMKRAVSKAQLEARKIELLGREALITEVVKQVSARISKLRNTPEYADILKRLAIDGATHLGEQEVELMVAEEDRGILTPAFMRQISDELVRKGITGASLTLSKDTIRETGVVVKSRTGKVEIRNTLEGRINRMSRELRLLISKEIFGDGKNA